MPEVDDVVERIRRELEAQKAGVMNEGQFVAYGTPRIDLHALAIAALQSSQPREEGPDISDVLETARQRALVLFQAYALGVSIEYKRGSDQFVHDVKTFDAELKDALSYPISTPPLEQENTEERPISDATKRMAKTLGAELVRTEHLKPVEAQPRSPVEDALIEKVARALSIPQHHTTWDTIPEVEKDLFYMQADYAIYAIREALSQSPAIDPRVEEAMAGATGISSGPDSNGGMRVVVHFAEGGQETKLCHLLNTTLSAFGGKTDVAAR